SAVSCRASRARRADRSAGRPPRGLGSRRQRVSRRGAQRLHGTGGGSGGTNCGVSSVTVWRASRRKSDAFVSQSKPRRRHAVTLAFSRIGPTMHSVLSLILGGGRGTRLFPLTKMRSKPAMPLAGRYRLIDVPISNCINSGLNHIYVLTQFLSASLHRHISNTYKFDMFDRGFCEILAAQQTYENADWYQGTADAIRQNIRYIYDDYDEVLILSGDQLYRMDYTKLLKTHRNSGADVTIAVLPVDKSAISGFGLVKVGDDGRITGFIEKPKTEAAAAPFRAPADCST